nr:GNAT family N-acetyltransferase [Microbulbifer celer]
MYLTLADWRPTSNNPALQLRPVQFAGEVQTWVTVCSEAFGYRIDTAVIAGLAAHQDTRLWLAEIDGVAVATALLFRTGEVTGVHQVGVPERFRGRGIARELMQALLARCQQSGAGRVTLQASEMGEGLYRQLGFTPQFPIFSYRRP